MTYASTSAMWTPRAPTQAMDTTEAVQVTGDCQGNTGHWSNTSEENPRRHMAQKKKHVQVSLTPPSLVYSPMVLSPKLADT